MLRLYLDEDSMAHGLVVALRTRGVDVLTPLDAEMIERLDEEHLEYATSLGRVLYSFNIPDFARLHKVYADEGRSHAGLILARQKQYSVGEQLRRLLKLMAARSQEEMINRVEYLSAWP
jgi:hypothetical protein